MRENVGGADRAARSVVGPILVVGAMGPLGARRGRLLGLAALVAGVLLTETAITQVCPVNALVGVDTHASSSSGRSEDDQWAYP